jgi:hypothetical protein
MNTGYHGAGYRGASGAPDLATQAADGLMSAADKEKLDNLTAAWATDRVRYILVDYDGGDDDNIGYVDAVAGSTIVPTGLAIKTLTRLAELLPKFGAFRNPVVLIKPRAGGAIYKKPDGVTDDDLDARSFGYNGITFRGSDLTNSVADRLQLGGMISLPGPNVGESWTITSLASASAFNVAAGGLTAEPALIGRRLRFKGNVTASLANKGAMIHGNTGTQISIGAYAGAPVTNDEFWIEEPGVRVRSVLVQGVNPQGTGAGRFTKTQIVGITSTAATPQLWESGAGNLLLCQCDFPNSYLTVAASHSSDVDFSEIWTDETGTTRQIGPSSRQAGNPGGGLQAGVSGNFQGYLNYVNVAHLQTIASSFRTSNCYVAGCYFAGNVEVTNSGQPAPETAFDYFHTFNWGFSSAGFIGRNRHRGTLTFKGVTGQISAVTIEAGAGIKFKGVNNLLINDVSGSSSTFAFDGSTSLDSVYRFGEAAANTLSGSTGEINMGGPVKNTYASLAVTNVIDEKGNRWSGAAARVTGQALKLSNQSGSAVAVGQVVRSNGTTGQVAKAFADDTANADGAFAVAVTPPASAADGYFVTDGAAWVQFDGAPMAGVLAYLSVTTAGHATVTSPAVAGTNRKLRLGRVIRVSGTLGLVDWRPENLSQAADAAP